MKEGCQTFWILKDRIIELFGSELVSSSRQGKNDPEATQRSLRLLFLVSKGRAITLLSRGQMASAQAFRKGLCGRALGMQSCWGRTNPSWAWKADHQNQRDLLLGLKV